MIEFALVIMLLLLIAFGVVDLGRVFHGLITISNAAREGARYGMIYPNDATGIRNAAITEALSSGISLGVGNIAIACEDLSTPAGCDSGRPIRVTVTYSFDLFMGWILTSPLQLTRYVEMIVP
jgi:Flp pilus assembly protein TadG